MGGWRGRGLPPRAGGREGPLSSPVREGLRMRAATAFRTALGRQMGIEASVNGIAGSPIASCTGPPLWIPDLTNLNLQDAREDE
jgi:hypothetical protein